MGLHQFINLLYTQFHSCETALIKIANDALWAMEQKNITILVIMDLSVAFDTVNHAVLLEVLYKCFGIEGVVLNGFVVIYHLDSSKLTLVMLTQI